MSKVTTTFEAVDQGLSAHIKKIDKDTEKMSDTVKDSSKSINLSFGSMVAAGAGLALGIGAVKAAFSAAAGVVRNFGEALDMGGRLSDLAASTGETAGNLLLLERSFDNSGVGAEKVGSSINKLQKFMSDAEIGTKRNIDVMNKLGLSYDTLVKMTPTDQLELIAKKISSIESPTEKAAAAMNIFGKSGGALLPMLQNFSGEMDNAQSELGSLTRIMDEKNAVFDTISDKISIIKGKFTEFAAGLLSKVTPALELFTVALSRVDAAGIGEKIADAFIGGQKAMDGFGAALTALKIGEFGMSWEITFKSIELQLKETFNQIHKYSTSTLSGILAAIKSLFGEGSAIVGILTSTFELLAAKMGKILAKGIGSLLGGIIPGISDKVDAELTYLDSKINVSKARIGSAVQDLVPQLKDAGEAFGVGFDDSWAKSKPIINTIQLEADLAVLKANLAAKAAEKAADELKLNKNNPLSPMEESGKKILVDMRKSSDALKNMKKDVEEISKIQKLRDQLQDAKAEKEFGEGRLQDQFKKQINEGNLGKAERTIEKIKQKEIEKSIRTKEDGTFDRRSVDDMAREAGIKTFGKSKKELLEELAKKKQEAEADIKPGKEGDKKAIGKEPAKPKEDTLLEVVKMIKEIVGKIEPKLPQRALI